MSSSLNLKLLPGATSPLRSEKMLVQSPGMSSSSTLGGATAVTTTVVVKDNHHILNHHHHNHNQHQLEDHQLKDNQLKDNHPSEQHPLVNAIKEMDAHSSASSLSLPHSVSSLAQSHASLSTAEEPVAELAHVHPANGEEPAGKRRKTEDGAAVAAETLSATKQTSSLEFVSAELYVRHHLDLFFPKEAAAATTSATSTTTTTTTTTITTEEERANRLLDCIDSVQLHYPDGAFQETFPLISPLREGYNPIQDLVKTVQLLAYDTPNVFGDPDRPLEDGLYQRIERAAKRKDYPRLKSLVLEFNAEMDRLRADGHFQASEQRPLSYAQTVILLDQIYARTVTDPDALRQYKGFSKEVYGETRHPTIHDIIQRIPIRRSDIFLDLGSGIGNVVLQVAAETRCKAYGVELLETPALFARHQLLEFRARMRMLGRTMGSVHLRRGDFLEDANVHKILEKTDVLFVNNYAFESDVNWRLKQSFLGMKEGAVIISFVAFRSLDYCITPHNMNDISSILTVERVVYAPGGVSWTGSPGEFFIHRIDRRPLKRFLAGGGSSGSQRGGRSRKNKQ